MNPPRIWTPGQNPLTDMDPPVPPPFECLETLMEHEARVYEMASPKGLIH